MLFRSASAAVAMAVLAILALRAQQVAKQNEMKAKTATEKAVANEQRAVASEQRAVASEQKVTGERDRAEQALYLAQIRRGAELVNAKEFSQARRLLMNVQQTSRRWEWAYLIARCGFKPFSPSGAENASVARATLANPEDANGYIRDIDLRYVVSHFKFPIKLSYRNRPHDASRQSDHELSVQINNLKIFSLYTLRHAFITPEVSADHTTLVLSLDLGEHVIRGANTSYGDTLDSGEYVLPLPDIVERSSGPKTSANDLITLRAKYPAQFNELHLDSDDDTPPTVCISSDQRQIFVHTGISAYTLDLSGKIRRSVRFEGIESPADPPQLVRCGFSPNGREVARSFWDSYDQGVQIWSTVSGRLLYTSSKQEYRQDSDESNPNSARGVAWSSDGSLFAVAFSDGISLFREAGGPPLQIPRIELNSTSIELQVPAFSLRYSPDRTRLQVGNTLLDAKTFTEFLSFPPGTTVASDWSAVTIPRTATLDEEISLRFWTSSAGDLGHLSTSEHFLRQQIDTPPVP